MFDWAELNYERRHPSKLLILIINQELAVENNPAEPNGRNIAFLFMEEIILKIAVQAVCQGKETMGCLQPSVNRPRNDVIVRDSLKAFAQVTRKFFRKAG